MSDFNQTIVDEFRANEGKVGGYFANAALLLLTTTGAKSGQPRLSPLAYVMDGDRIVIIASKGGADTNPDWYHNIVAHPEANVELGNERFQVRGTVVADESERKRLYAKMVAKMPPFADYERATTRRIPVIILERVK